MIATEGVDTDKVMPSLTARRVAGRLRALVKTHEMKNGADLTWMTDPVNPPACRGAVMVDITLDTMFFPETSAGVKNTIVPEVLCASCPVKVACLDFAIKNDYVGVWGGEVITNADVASRQRARAATRRLAERQAKQWIREAVGL